jgi:hypothetical protein
MRVDLPKFAPLYGKLFEVDYNSAASIRAATSKGAPFLASHCFCPPSPPTPHC